MTNNSGSKDPIRDAITAFLIGYTGAYLLNLWLERQQNQPLTIGNTGSAATAVSDTEWQRFLTGHSDQA